MARPWQVFGVRVRVSCSGLGFGFVRRVSNRVQVFGAENLGIRIQEGVLGDKGQGYGLYLDECVLSRVDVALYPHHRIRDSRLHLGSSVSVVYGFRVQGSGFRVQG